MNLELKSFISTFYANVFWIRGFLIAILKVTIFLFLSLERLLVLVKKSEWNKDNLWSMNITLPEDIKSNIDFTSLNTSFSNELVDFIDSIPLGLKITHGIVFLMSEISTFVCYSGLDSFIMKILAETQQKDPWKISFGLSSATV